MKVVLFSRYPEDSLSPHGGVESVTVVLAAAMARLDLDVHVVTLDRRRDMLDISTDAGVTIHRLPGSRWPQILDILVGPGRRKLVRYITDLHPDILHTHETFGLTLGGIAIPHVFTVHGFDHANLPADSAGLAAVRSQLWKQVERHGLSGHKNIISISPYVRAMIEPLTDATIYDIDNPVDERFFNIDRRPQPGRILCVGWLNERKNTLGAVQALAAAVNRGADARLVIAGRAKQPEYLDRVKQCIEENSLGDRVELLGHISHAQLDNELARASVMLLPSRQENAPMAISEAMAAGVAVVAADRCGMPFMVTQGETGLLVNPESTADIADALVRLTGDPELCNSMGAAARQAAMHRFHPDSVAIKTRAVYEQILSQAKAGAPEFAANVR